MKVQYHNSFLCRLKPKKLLIEIVNLQDWQERNIVSKVDKDFVGYFLAFLETLLVS